MPMLRAPSARPEFVTDATTGSSVGFAGFNQVGFAGPLSRERVLFALPLKEGPTQVDPAILLHDIDMGYLADPGGNLIGENNSTWVNRMITATKAVYTRRL